MPFAPGSIDHEEDIMMIRVTTAVLAAGALLSITYAEDQPAGRLSNPIEILKKADAATRAVKAVSYSTTIAPTGAAKGRRPRLQGQAFLSGWVRGRPARFRHVITQKNPGEEKTQSFTGGWDGENFYLIDHQTKTAYVDMDPQVMGKMSRVLRGFGMLEFVHPTPFSDEINGVSQKLEGVEDIAGEPCYKVHVEYTAGGPQANWFFSTKDFLPRRVVRLFNTPGGQTAGLQTTVSHLKIIPSGSNDLDDLSAFKLPKGYKQTDDFAP